MQAPGIDLGKKDAPSHCFSWLCRRSADSLSLLLGCPAGAFNGSASTKLWLHHTSSYKKREITVAAKVSGCFSLAHHWQNAYVSFLFSAGTN